MLHVPVIPVLPLRDHAWTVTTHLRHRAPRANLAREAHCFAPHDEVPRLLRPQRIPQEVRYNDLLMGLQTSDSVNC